METAADTRDVEQQAPSGGGAPVVALVSLGLFMTTLDASIVNIGLPSIARAFRTPLDGAVEWVVIGYLVVIAGLLLTFGRLSDLVGRRPIWTLGLVVFTIGSVACGAAPSLGLLIAARALQGVGGALIFSTSAALLSGAVPPTQRGRALGWGAVAIALGASAGPTIGGILTEHATWRWIFYVNVPFGIAAILATWRLLPRSPGGGAGGLDLRGAFALAIALAALNLGLSFGQDWGWTSARVLATLGIGIVALGAAAFVERRSPHPIVDLRLFRHRVFASAVVSLLCSMLSLFAVGFLLPFYLEELRGFSTEHAGLLLTPFPLAIMLVAPTAGSLADRFGSRWLAPLALLITAAALLFLAQLDADSTTWAMVWRLALAGVGLGLFQAPNTNALMGAAPASQQGMASGVFATTRVTGQALSVAIAGAVFTSFGAAAAGSALIMQHMRAPSASAAGQLMLESTFLRGLHAALITCSAFAILGAVAALARGHESPPAGRMTPAHLEA